LEEKSRNIRSIIEIKRTWSCNKNLRTDAKRIKDGIKKYAANSGYLIVYSEFSKDPEGGKLMKRLSDFSKKLELDFINEHNALVHHGIGKEQWSCGFALLKA
jgi:hypothetical protein